MRASALEVQHFRQVTHTRATYHNGGPAAVCSYFLRPRTSVPLRSRSLGLFGVIAAGCQMEILLTIGKLPIQYLAAILILGIRMIHNIT